MSTLNVTSIKGRAGAIPSLPDGAVISGIATIGADGIDLTGGINVTGIATVKSLALGGTLSGVTDIDATGSLSLGGNVSIAATDNNNNVTIKNTSPSDSSGARRSKIIFQGTRSGGEVSDLVHIAGQHDGGNDNDYGAFRVHVNNGSGVTERFGVGQGGEIRINASIGSAGQVLTSAGGGSPAVWAAASGGIEEYDEWAVTANSSPTGWDNAVVGSNSNAVQYGNTVAVARMTTTQNPLFTKIGTGMSFDANTGVWTFPATGYWEVNFVPQIYSNGAANHNWYVSATTDGGTTWKGGAQATGDGDGIYASNNRSSSGAGTYTFNVPVYMNITNTTNQKIRFVYSTTQGGIYYKGSTALPYTKWSFKKIA